MICIYAEVEAPDISFVESIVTSHEKVSKCAVLKYDDGYLVALTLKPIFTRSERRETLSYLKTILELYDINNVPLINLYEDTDGEYIREILDEELKIFQESVTSEEEKE